MHPCLLIVNRLYCTAIKHSSIKNAPCRTGFEHARPTCAPQRQCGRGFADAIGNHTDRMNVSWADPFRRRVRADRLWAGVSSVLECRMLRRFVLLMGAALSLAACADIPLGNIQDHQPDPAKK